jgi:hypothetical protein
MTKRQRMTRQVRAYEETAQLIEALVRLNPDRKFADVLDDWANRLYPETYQAIKEKNELVDERLGREDKK